MAGGDRIAPIVIFCILFLALTLAVVPQMAKVFYANAKNSLTQHATGFEMFGGRQYQMWYTTSGGPNTNSSVQGNVTEWTSWENVGLNRQLGPGLESRLHFSFYDPGSSPTTHHRLDVFIVRNNTGYMDHLDNVYADSPFVRTNAFRDFVFFREYAYSGSVWDNHHNFYDVVSFNQLIVSANSTDATYSSSSLQNLTTFSVLGKYNITFFAGPEENANLTLVDALTLNHFTIQVGSDLLNLQSRSRIGMWNIIGDLFMFHSEDLGMPLWLNAFISSILWICVGFSALAIISRFIPTIPGL